MPLVDSLLLSILSVVVLTSSDVFCWSLNEILMTGPKVGDDTLEYNISSSDAFGRPYPPYLVFAESVSWGAEKGVVECRRQFKWDRWSCPHDALNVISRSTHRRVDKETAFVQAISSAGVMYVLIRNCSLGNFDVCGCDNTKKGKKGAGNWVWGGCSENIKFGEHVSRQFVDNFVLGTDSRAAIHIHNNEVGRKAVHRTMQLVCKCHGVSGSCQMRTCWIQLSNFHRTGNYLKRRYFTAAYVSYQDGKLRHGNTASSVQFPKVSKTDLVYLDSSPNYCKVNRTAEILGTIGRQCSRPAKQEKASKWERKSCRRLCTSCGLKVRKRTAVVTFKCNCKFRWCCRVECQQCVDTVQHFYCQN